MEKGKFSEELNMEATELRLGLPGSTQSISIEKPTTKIGNKRPFSDETSDRNDENVSETAPAPKAQIVGWPPIRSYRMNHFQASKKKEAEASGIFIKVSMDGAPYLRKIDLKMYTDYQDLLKALEKMFSCFTMGVGKGSEYVSTYEDKDGDWMLVGDVPWEMFITSCKKLRIMKGSEAKGLSCCESSV